MACPNLQQDGATYGSGPGPLYNGYCECFECEEQREEDEAAEEAADAENAYQMSLVSASKLFTRLTR